MPKIHFPKPLTVYSALKEAIATVPKGKIRRNALKALDRLDYKKRVDDAYADAGAIILKIQKPEPRSGKKGRQV